MQAGELGAFVPLPLLLEVSLRCLVELSISASLPTILIMHGAAQLHLTVGLPTICF